MQLGGALPGPVIAQIVHVDAVDHVRDSPLPRHLMELRKQLVFAMEAAVAVVLYILRIFELARGDDFVTDTPVSSELLGSALVRRGERCRIGGDRQRLFSQRRGG